MAFATAGRILLELLSMLFARGAERFRCSVRLLRCSTDTDSDTVPGPMLLQVAVLCFRRRVPS